jgi:hypothetical protein
MNMQPQHRTIAEHLADIVDILRIGNKSGTLVVERGEDTTLEEGLIIFAAGQAVEAKVNQQSGSAAFSYLSTWQKCRFSFVNHAVAGNSSLKLTTPPPHKQSGPLNSTTTTETTNAHTTRPTQTPTQQNSEQNTRPTSPQRLPRGDEALQYPENIQLPRIHRRLLLLIDGRRNRSELARLMTRDTGEIQKLLNDLERTGLIHN